MNFIQRVVNTFQNAFYGAINPTKGETLRAPLGATVPGAGGGLPLRGVGS